MTTTKPLRTLKDIESAGYRCCLDMKDPQKSISKHDGTVYSSWDTDELRSAAKEWVKAIERDDDMTAYELYSNSVDWVKHFFNLEE